MPDGLGSILDTIIDGAATVGETVVDFGNLVAGPSTNLQDPIADMVGNLLDPPGPGRNFTGPVGDDPRFAPLSGEPGGLSRQAYSPETRPLTDAEFLDYYYGAKAGLSPGARGATGGGRVQTSDGGRAAFLAQAAALENMRTSGLGELEEMLRTGLTGANQSSRAARNAVGRRARTSRQAITREEEQLVAALAPLLQTILDEGARTQSGIDERTGSQRQRLEESFAELSALGGGSDLASARLAETSRADQLSGIDAGLADRLMQLATQDFGRREAVARQTGSNARNDLRSQVDAILADLNVATTQQRANLRNESAAQQFQFSNDLLQQIIGTQGQAARAQPTYRSTPGRAAAPLTPQQQRDEFLLEQQFEERFNPPNPLEGVTTFEGLALNGLLAGDEGLVNAAITAENALRGRSPQNVG